MSVQKKKYLSLSVGVVGAGPAGSMAAYLLARQGFKVTLLERSAEIKRKVCGEYLCPSGVQLLSDLSILDSTCRGFLKLRGMVLNSPQGLSVNTDFPDQSNGLSLNRKIFDQRLLNLATEAGADILLDWMLISVRQLQDGKWEITNNKDQNLTFDLLIAADGRQSKIGHYLGHIKEQNTKRAALHCYLPRKEFIGQRRGEMHIFNDGSYCGLDPISDEEVNFSIVVDSEKLKVNKPEALISQVINSHSRLQAQFTWNEEEQKEIKIVTCLKNENNYIAGQGLVYVGDAAGFIDPLTGEGIYNAILSAKILADAIAQKSSVEEALSEYKVRKKQIRRKKEMMNKLFQKLIRHPFLVKQVAVFLSKNKKRGDTFIGIIGNIYEPLEGLIRLIKA